MLGVRIVMALAIINLLFLLSEVAFNIFGIALNLG
jgi:hypothetical protein